MKPIKYTIYLYTVLVVTLIDMTHNWWNREGAVSGTAWECFKSGFIRIKSAFEPNEAKKLKSFNLSCPLSGFNKSLSNTNPI